MKQTVGDYFFLIFSIVGSLASIFSYTEYIGPKLNDQGIAGVIFLGILCFLFFGYSIYLVIKYRKKSKYPEIFEDLNLGFSEIHSVDRRKYPSIDNEKQNIYNSLAELCNSLSDCFTKINGHHIGVCIKYITGETQQRPFVKTLVRDKKSKSKGRKTGEADKKHWIDLNSDFNYIYSNYNNDNIDTSCYYKIWLPNAMDYINTNLPNDWPPKKTIWPVNLIIRQLLWPLRHYRSTLVVPIIPLIDEQKKYALRGFLCIDSPRNVAFYKNTDKEILRGVADGIYKHIDKFHYLDTKRKKKII
ncbi:hypothetical protein HYS72_01910 [Candidatus Pacearchaeota archaeon]|nr:hypothetical protein [Candidatus Pacearchaeota archaeon]MBI2057096.1 hypothetical protein [Candidatus Pacearchaeota archaeon]